MTRGIGEFGPVRDVLPEWIAVVFALLTQLGDVWFLSALLVACYWLDRPDREDVATVAGVWLAGVGAYTGLKAAFGLPRPEQPLLAVDAVPQVFRPVYEATAFASGYGFPSGHAVNSTIVYVGLAIVLSTDDRRRWLLRSGGLVAVVSLSRVVLGVHYVVDVVAGVAVGLTLLLASLALADRLPIDRPTTTFGLASVLTAASALSSGGYGNGYLVLAAVLGGVAGWQFVAHRRSATAFDAPSSQRSYSVVPRRKGRFLLATGAVSGLVVLVVSSAGPVTVVVGLATAVGVAAPTVRHSTAAQPG